MGQIPNPYAVPSAPKTAEGTLTVAAGKALRLIGLKNTEYKTSATAQKRYYGVQLKESGGLVIAQYYALLETISATFKISGLIGTPAATVIDNATANVVHMALPDLWIPTGFKWELVFINKHAEDTGGFHIWCYQETDAL